jgi:thiamine-phosphate pyrophosphorylase
MNRADAEILWDTACVLARDAADVSRARGRAGPDLPPLLFFTDPERTPRPWETAARLPAGAAVVFRHFGRADARDTALRLREVSRAGDILMLVGQDAELAESVGADGVHLPERALVEVAAIRAIRPDWRITGAAHALATLETTGLDALTLSPVFPAGGPSGERPALGPETFRAWVEAAACPVYALGGIDSARARRLVGSGACGIAGISAIQAAFGPN